MASKRRTCSFNNILSYRGEGIDMRRYALASLEHKQNVDLRDYEDVIVEAVMAAMKDVEGVSVVVHEHYYEVSPSPSRSAGLGWRCCSRAPDCG